MSPSFIKIGCEMRELGVPQSCPDRHTDTQTDRQTDITKIRVSLRWHLRAFSLLELQSGAGRADSAVNQKNIQSNSNSINIGADYFTLSEY